MQRWEVRLLGRMSLQRGDEVVTRFRTRTTDAIFAYLALHVGKPIPRDELASLGWPEADQSQARQSLRMVLTSLRQVLGADTIEADRLTVRLKSEHFLVDVEEFRNCRDPSLYGGRLLEGMSEEWILSFAVDLEELYTQVVLDALDNLPRDAATALATDLLQRDPSRLDVRAKLRDVGLGQIERDPSATPYVVTSFIGRERELADLERLFENHRLVTLTGLGGSGKTRIAAAFWSRKQPESWFIALADHNDPATIAEAIREGLRLPSSTTLSAFERIVGVLGQSSGLLVLDNFEHLVEGAEVISELLSRCPELRMLVTSQVGLGLSGEVDYPVGPMAIESWRGLSDSMLLFETRAQAVVPDFVIGPDNRETVAELCRRLDGFPLALEIAAARSRIYSPEEMLAQLEDRFDFLIQRGRSSGRHASLRAALDWGFDRLHEDDQTLLMQLSVFRGGFTLDAVEQVCDTKRASVQVETLLIHSWVDRSMSRERTRFRLLESIRDYGAEMLTPKELRRLQQAHADHYLNLATECNEASFKPEEPEFHRRVHEDIHNLEAAGMYFRENDAEAELKLATGLNWYWILKGQAKIGESRIRWALDRVSTEPRQSLALALHALGNFIMFQGRYAEAESGFLRAHRICVEIGDSLFEGLTHCQVAQVHAEQGLIESARTYGSASLRSLLAYGDENWVGAGYVVLALIENRAGDSTQALRFASLAVEHCRRGGYPWGLASALNELAMAYHLAGDYARAYQVQQESIALKLESEAPRSLALSYADQTATCLALRELGHATDSLKECLNVLADLGELAGYPRVFGLGAQLLLARGDSAGAAKCFGTMLGLTKGRSLSWAEQLCADVVAPRLGAAPLALPGVAPDQLVYELHAL